MGRYMLIQYFYIISSESTKRAMKIQCLLPSNPKLRLRLQNNFVKNHFVEKFPSNQKGIAQIKARNFSKQNQQKIAFPLQSRDKFKTFISLPKNRKKTLSHSNSSLEKKLYPENKQKIDEFMKTQPIRSFTKASETMFDQFQAHQVLQTLFASSIAFQRQNRQIGILRADLLNAISLLLGLDHSPLEDKRFLAFARILRDIRSDSETSAQLTHPQLKNKHLKIRPSVVKLVYLPPARPKKTLTFCSKNLQYTYKQKREERNSYQYEIRRLRDSLLSQQNLVTNIKNCHRVKHGSRQDEKLDFPILNPKAENNPAVEYMLQQNELLMKVANQEFKKYESEIYEYGLLLQSKHLEIDLEYQQFTAQQQRDNSLNELQETLRATILNPIKADCYKYEDATLALQVFFDKMMAKDTRLKKLIEIKSTFISQFSSKMEFWIESLTFKKEFTQNLANYIERQGEESQEMIKSLRRSLMGRSYQGLLDKVDEIRRALQVFFENLLNSHQFS